ncbi:MAG: DUF4351 domain-containing protein [Nostoc sp. S4]|nr:DUF4351 domain-containing protein [Nostoc sp. S4]
MHKSKLIFRFILSVAIATSVQLSSRNNYAVAQDASFNPTVEFEQQNDTSEDINFGITGIGIGVIAGLLIFGFYQKHRQRQLYSTAKIDRFREEFLCGSLADYYLSNSQANASSTNYRQSLATPNKEKIPTSPTPEESLLTPNLVVFQEQLATIEPKEQEKIMQIVSTWMQQAQKHGEFKLLMHLLNRRLGEISPQIKSRIANLSTPELENLAEALLDFSCVADLEAWFENIS